jgi:hypothetical protein
MYVSLNFKTATLIRLTLAINLILDKSLIITKLILIKLKLASWKSMKKTSLISPTNQKLYNLTKETMLKSNTSLLIKDLLNFNIFTKE